MQITRSIGSCVDDDGFTGTVPIHIPMREEESSTAGRGWYHAFMGDRDSLEIRGLVKPTVIDQDVQLTRYEGSQVDDGDFDTPC